jgi:hypothetical protein
VQDLLVRRSRESYLDSTAGIVTVGSQLGWEPWREILVRKKLH